MLKNIATTVQNEMMFMCIVYKYVYCVTICKKCEGLNKLGVEIFKILRELKINKVCARKSVYFQRIRASVKVFRFACAHFI